MKRRFAGALAALLVLVMGTTNVYAAASPTGADIVAQLRQEAENYKNDTSVSGKTSTNIRVELEKRAVDPETLSNLKFYAAEQGTVLDILTVIDLDLSPYEYVPESTVAKGINVTFSIKGLKSGDNVYLFHMNSDGEWETLKPYRVGTDYLIVTMYSFSPIGAVRFSKDVVLTPSDQNSSGGGSGGSGGSGSGGSGGSGGQTTEDKIETYYGNIIAASGLSSTGNVVLISKRSISANDMAMIEQTASVRGNAQIVGVAELSSTVSTTVLGKGIKLYLTVAGVSAGENIYLFHKKTDGSWETLKPSSVSENYVEIPKVYSLSTIAVVRCGPGVNLSVSNAGDDSEENPGQSPGENPGENPGQNPGENPGQNPGQNPDQDQSAASIEAQNLANRITFVSANSSVGSVVMLAKSVAWTSDVTYAKGQAGWWGGTILGMAEFTSTADAATLAKGVMVTLYVTDVQKGDNICVKHKLPNGVWETIKPNVESGYVTFKLYSLSPLAVIRYPAGVAISSTQQVPVVGSDPTNSNYPPGGKDPNPGQANDQNNNQSNPQTNDQNQTNPQTNDQNQSNPQTNSQNQNNNQSQTNDNNQSNSQSNNQNNPVNVNQNVTVNYPENLGKYSDGYGDGYKDGYSAGKKTGGSSSSGGSASKKIKKSPKTGAALPALPFFAIIAAAGSVVCRKKTCKNY